MSRREYDKYVYLDTMEALIQDWDTEIERFKSKAHRTRMPLGAEYDHQIKLLRKRCTEFRQRLRELRRSDENNWSGMQAGLERAATRVEKVLDTALFRFG